jgi:hypothetical protein
MVLNPKHLEALEAARANHVTRINELRKQINLQEDETQAHSLILAVSGNRRLISSLERVTDDLDFLSSVEGREIEYLKSLDVELPPESSVKIGRNKKKVTRVDLIVRTGEYSFKMTWSAKVGFFTTPT